MNITHRGIYLKVAIKRVICKTKKQLKDVKNQALVVQRDQCQIHMRSDQTDNVSSRRNEVKGQVRQAELEQM